MKYIVGITIQNKQSRISYKNRKIKLNPKEEWHIALNTHEAIIDKKTFDKVQKSIITQKYHHNEKKHHYLLDGLLFCYECKHKIGIRLNKNTNKFMVCNNYRRNSKLGNCTSHGFSYNILEENILQYVKEMLVSVDSKKIELIIQKQNNNNDSEKNKKNLQIEIELIKNNIDEIYIDKLNKKITEEMYERLFDKLTNQLHQKENELNNIQEKEILYSQNNTNFLDIQIHKFLKFDSPTSEFMKIIIKKIEIHQDKQVDIYFNFPNTKNFIS